MILRRNCCRGWSETCWRLSAVAAHCVTSRVQQCRIRSCGILPAHQDNSRQASPPIGINRRSSGGRRAGPEGDATRFERTAGARIRMHDAFETERHRQGRGVRNKSRRCEIDRGADRTVIVVIAGILRRRLARRIHSAALCGATTALWAATGRMPSRCTWPNESTICSASAANANHAPRRLWR